MDYTLYGLTNKRQHIIPPLVVFDKQGRFTFSEQYYMLGRPTVHLHDFKYVVQITISTDDVYIAKTEHDLEDIHIESDLPFKVHVKDKTYNGLLLFNTCTTFPSFYFPDKGTHYQYIYHRLPTSFDKKKTDRKWINTEYCRTLTKAKCVDSDGCTWSKKRRCQEDNRFQSMPLRNINQIMKPYKYYIFSEYELAPKNIHLRAQQIWFKPRGLWFAQGSEWLQFMKQYSFWMSKYNYLYEIQLNKDNIYFVSSLKELQEFSQNFQVHTKVGMNFEGVYINTLIDWKKFIEKERASGIVISPNLKKIFYKQVKSSTLPDFFDKSEWYVTWDVASGVLWNVKAIKNVKLIYRREEGTLEPYKEGVAQLDFSTKLQTFQL
jgi:hypothetical protein